jgi:hypothetical protein
MSRPSGKTLAIGCAALVVAATIGWMMMSRKAPVAAPAAAKPAAVEPAEAPPPQPAPPPAPAGGVGSG